MLPKFFCNSWKNLTKISRQSDSKKSFFIRYSIDDNSLNLTSIHYPKINRFVHFFAPTVLTIEKVNKMPHAVDICNLQMSKFIVTHAAKDPVINNGYDYIGKVPLLNACTIKISSKLRHYIEECASLCCPKDIYICNGTDTEYMQMLKILQKTGTIESLPKYENCWLAKTNPADVARIEKRTFICSDLKSDTIPTPRKGIIGELGNWISPNDMEQAILERFPNCMKDIAAYHYEGNETAKEEKLKRAKEIVPYYLERLDAQVQKNGGYFVGGALSWADFTFVGLLDYLNFMMRGNIIEKYDNLKQLKQKIEEIPSIKSWIEKRPSDINP